MFEMPIQDIKMLYTPGSLLFDYNFGILFMLTVSSLATCGILFALQPANSKYAFLGSLRCTAQLISYGLVLSPALFLALLLTSSLNLTVDFDILESLHFRYLLCSLSTIYDFIQSFLYCQGDSDGLPNGLPNGDTNGDTNGGSSGGPNGDPNGGPNGDPNGGPGDQANGPLNGDSGDQPDGEPNGDSGDHSDDQSSTQSESDGAGSHDLCSCSHSGYDSSDCSHSNTTYVNSPDRGEIWCCNCGQVNPDQHCDTHDCDCYFHSSCIQPNESNGPNRNTNGGSNGGA